MTAYDASRQINYQDHSPSGKRIGKNQMDDYSLHVAFTARIDNTEVFRRSGKITVNTETLNALYNVNIH